NVPAVGCEGFLASYWSAFQFIRKANVILQEGYQKHKNGVFKIPLVDRWLVVVTGDQLLDNLRTAPESVLSMWDAMLDLLQLDHTLGRQFRENPYHDSIIRTTLTKNLATILPNIVDESIHAFPDMIANGQEVDGGWISIDAYDEFSALVCRVLHRVLVGNPVCRNKSYLQLNIQFSAGVTTEATVINAFPRFLQPFIGNLYNKVSGRQTRVLEYLGPEIEERKLKIAELGSDYEGRPDDLISWLMDSAPSALERETSSIALRVLIANFMAHHSAFTTFTHAVYHLAAEPFYADDLREELLMHLSHPEHIENWTEKNLDQCWKLDSFLKETLRMHGIGALALPRKSLIRYTFPNGVVVPPGTLVTACSTATHLDEEKYPEAHKFDGFRFEKLRVRAKTLEQGSKHKVTSASSSFLAFGGGKHICPGRFFGTSLLKCMMAHLITHYDIKMENEGVRPLDDWFGPVELPARQGKVLFRKRDG
ncbi:uncharacterized protein LACBIDRAFT_255302, partial [Laccaria bicolor S238N-H82]